MLSWPAVMQPALKLKSMLTSLSQEESSWKEKAYTRDPSNPIHASNFPNKENSVVETVKISPFIS